MIDFVIESLNLTFKQLEIFVDYFFENMPFLFVRCRIIFRYLLYLLDGVNVMHLFALFMMLNTPLCLADSA